MREISEPDGETMLEIATNLHAKKDVEFAASKNLDNGQTQLTYNETINGSAGRGNLEIPKKITLTIQPFTNGPAYTIMARFRYRINSGALQMWYTLDNPHLVIEDAVKEAAEKIKTGITTGMMVMGKI